MRNIKLTVEYDGTQLSGWQRQENGPTVQAAIEAALEKLLQGFVPISGASRTDAGVSALGQVASFKADTTIANHGFLRGLTMHLPPTIAIAKVEDVLPDFHARFSSSGKHYRYTIFQRIVRSPFWTRAWQIAAPLDIEAMNQASQGFLGEHDYAAFRAASCEALTTQRKISRVQVSQPEPGIIHIDVEGNAFLRNMVRIMVGTLVHVGLGKFAPGDVARILQSRDRTKAGPTAPAEGLCLMQVYYDPTRAKQLLPRTQT